MCYARSSIRSTIDRYKKVCSNNSNSGIVTEINAQHEMLLAEIEFLQKREIELENESVCLRSKNVISKTQIAEMERFQQANLVTGQELNAVHALASRNFFGPAIIEGGGTAYSHPDKKILHLG
ncbi:Agamous-like MADS-box protein AGL11 [Citrus sinensis]|nr:Agamous-like MADS-box protein AGL11 [Citrus sinensis]